MALLPRPQASSWPVAEGRVSQNGAKASKHWFLIWVSGPPGLPVEPDRQERAGKLAFPLVPRGVYFQGSKLYRNKKTNESLWTCYLCYGIMTDIRKTYLLYQSHFVYFFVNSWLVENK